MSTEPILDKLIFKSSSSTVYLLYIATNLTFSLGFDLFYEGMLTCANESITTNTGVLFSNEYSQNYSENQNCTTKLYLKDAVGIELTFDYFHTESVSDLNLFNNLCTLDFVEITVKNRTFRICGNWSGKEHLLFFKFTTTEVDIRFVSNQNITKTGFKLKWFFSRVNSLHFGNLSTCVFPLVESHESCYEFVTEELVWEASNDVCRSRGAVLARVDSLEDHKHIERLLFSSNLESKSAWIGANDRLFEGDFMWTDRSSVHFQYWFPGWLFPNISGPRSIRQPSDDGFANEDCVEIRRHFAYHDKGFGLTHSYFWNDRNCQEKNPFICQHSKTKHKRSAERQPVQCNEVCDLSRDSPIVTISSPSFPAHYLPLLSCHVIITAPFGYQIYIDFTHFDIEYGKGCEYDNVTVSNFPLDAMAKTTVISGMDGGVVNSHGRVIYCGNWNRRLKFLRWKSDVNRAVITLQTDFSKQFGGFELKATLINLEDQCRSATPSHDWIYGPGGCWYHAQDPAISNYTQNINSCKSEIWRQSNTTDTEINFVGELLAQSNITDCTNIWTPDIDSTNITDSNCDAVTVCPVQYSEDNLLVEYESFKTQVPCTQMNTVICRKHAKEPSNTKTTEKFKTSPGNIDTFCTNDQYYANNMNNTYEFNAPLGYRIIVELYNYNIEYQDDCLYDYLETRGMVIDVKLCGQSEDTKSLISLTNKASLTFMTDDDVTNCGFNLSWYWVTEGKVFDILETTDNIGVIKSVNFPKAFPDSLEGCHEIIAPKEHRVMLKFQNISFTGEDCDTSNLTLYSDNTLIRTICSTDQWTESIFGRSFISYGRSLTICLKVTQLQRNDGFLANYSYVSKVDILLQNTLVLPPNTSTTVASIMYPLFAPSNVLQDVVITTHIGYMISLTFLNIVANHSKPNCSRDIINIFDISLKPESKIPSESYSCINDLQFLRKNSSSHFMSYLNAVRIIVSNGSHGDGNLAISFNMNVISIPDPLYLNKTVLDSGTIVTCDNATCINGGECTAVGNDRYTCSCGPQYTGLFCQASQCDLHPCKHGTCSVTTTGYYCTCHVNYWGKQCDMDSTICRFMKCSGQGRCVAWNKTDVACLCDAERIGLTCETMVNNAGDTLTIGEKLLKEPIWIGMIVILNLIFFFCISYIIRRKCGDRIVKVWNKRAKTTSKDESTVETPTMSRSIFSINMDSPKIQKLSHNLRPSLKIIPGSSDKEDSSEIGPIRTPEIDEDNSVAAFKMFAAYNSKRAELSPGFASINAVRKELMTSSVRGIMSCGIQGGSVSLNGGLDLEPESEDVLPHGILRSYTINTGDYESVRKFKGFKKNKNYTYSGSPLSNRLQGARNKDDKQHKLSWVTQDHCYPEIRIINEHNQEERNSDSDNSGVCLVTSPEKHNYPANKQLAYNDVQMPTYTETLDSGYPSTTVSSNTNTSNTNSSTKINTKRSTSPLAAEKRKRFGSKNKSSSFYDISVGGPSLDIMDINYNVSQDTRSIHKSSWPKRTRMHFSSFDSEKCRACSDTLFSTMSCDSDLNKTHLQDSSFHMKHSSCDCERHRRHHRRRRRKPSCRHCIHSHRDLEYSTGLPHPISKRDTLHGRDNLPMNVAFGSSRCMSLNEIRKRYHRSMTKLSSTESETCSCSVHKGVRNESRHHRRSNHDELGKSLSYHRHRFKTFDENHKSRSWELARPESYKDTMMRSFLSDSYNTLDLDDSYSNHSLTDSSNTFKPLPSPNKSSGSQNADRSLATSEFSVHNRNNQVNENAVDSDVKYDIIKYDDPISEPTSDLSFRYEIPSFQKNQTSVKDSAYQTKQSSIDKHNMSIKREGSSETKPSQQTKTVEPYSRGDDKIRRHLQQAALKLAIIKRLQAKDHFSKDSAIHTFSEDDLSAEDTNTHRPLAKRTSGQLAFQMMEMNLSQVKEECSGIISRDSCQTPITDNTRDLARDTGTSDKLYVARKSPLSASIDTLQTPTNERDLENNNVRKLSVGIVSPYFTRSNSASSPQKEAAANKSNSSHQMANSSPRREALLDAGCDLDFVDVGSESVKLETLALAILNVAQCDETIKSDFFERETHV